MVKRQFDPEPIKTQLANLVMERDRLDQAIEALQSVLRNLEGLGAEQPELSIALKDSETTLHDAVKRA